MENTAYATAALSFIVIVAETIYLSTQTRNMKDKIDTRDYTTNVFIGTLVALIAMGISIMVIMSYNYNENNAVGIIILTVGVGLVLGLSSWYMSFVRLRVATST